MKLSVSSAAALMLFVARFAHAMPLATGADGEYRIALPSIPLELRPFSDRLHHKTSVARLLYFPLMERMPDGTLESNFLDIAKTRALDANFRVYVFCLKKGIRFSNGSLITARDLTASLAALHREQGDLLGSAEISEQESCARVALAQRNIDYIPLLTSSPATILEAASLGKAFPTGLGPYRISEARSSSLVLTATSKDSVKDIKTIVLVDAGSLPAPKRAEHAHDWNHATLSKEEREKLEHSQKRVDKPETSTVAAVLRIRDGNERKLFASCIGGLFDSFRLATSTLGSEARTTDSFLPKGMPGFEEKFSFSRLPATVGSCAPAKGARTLAFWTSVPDKVVPLRKWFAEVREKLPRPVEVNLVFANQAAARLRSHEEFLGVFSFGGYSGVFRDSELSAVRFLSALEGQDGALTGLPLDEFWQTLRAAQKAASKEERRELIARAHRSLLDSGAIIPLFSGRSTNFFPSWVDKTEFFDVGFFPRYERFTFTK